MHQYVKPLIINGKKEEEERRFGFARKGGEMELLQQCLKRELENEIAI